MNLKNFSHTDNEICSGYTAMCKLNSGVCIKAYYEITQPRFKLSNVLMRFNWHMTRPIYTVYSYNLRGKRAIGIIKL